MASEEVLYVEGGQALRGEVVVQGSKNAALPMIAASLLQRQKARPFYTGFHRSKTCWSRCRFCASLVRASNMIWSAVWQ